MKPRHVKIMENQRDFHLYSEADYLPNDFGDRRSTYKWSEVPVKAQETI